MQKSKPQSKQAFYSFPTPINLFETTHKAENQKRPEV
jgi:hypothetical protein